MKLAKNALRSKNVNFFPNFVVKLKAFELTYDYLILYFPVVFPVQNINRKFQFASMECIKSYPLKKIEKISLRLQNFKIFEIFDLNVLKIEFFPPKNHLAFATIERYDIELTNIKISDKNIVCRYADP